MVVVVVLVARPGMGDQQQRWQSRHGNISIQDRYGNINSDNFPSDFCTWTATTLCASSRFGGLVGWLVTGLWMVGKSIR